MQSAIQYNNYQRLIHFLAWNWTRKLNIEQDELFAEGNLVFCEALKKWDKAKSSFCTYLFISIEGHFYNMGVKKKENLSKGSLLGSVDTNSPDRSAEFWSGIRSLSSEAQEMVDLALSCPSELCQITTIRKHLHHEAGWTWRTIFAAVEEIKSVFH